MPMSSFYPMPWMYHNYSRVRNLRYLRNLMNMRDAMGLLNIRRDNLINHRRYVRRSDSILENAMEISNVENSKYKNVISEEGINELKK